MCPAETVDEARFPLLAAYAARLPRGLGSYETSQTKASVYLEALADKPFSAELRDALPDSLRDLVLQPRLVSTWVRTTDVQGLFLAICDAHRLGENEFEVWSYAVQRRLYRSPLYRGLMVLASPTMLLTGTRVRWSSIHRGSEIEVTSSGREATIALLSPPNLYAPRNLLGFASGFRAVLDLSNAQRVSVKLTSCKPARSEFQITWE